jgi:hypothetical protein
MAAGSGVPYVDLPILTAGDQQLAVGREGAIHDSCVVPSGPQKERTIGSQDGLRGTGSAVVYPEA